MKNICFVILFLIFLLVPSPKGIAEKIDNITNTYLWRFATTGRVSAFPVIEDNRIYFASQDRFLYALNIDGVKLWRLNLGRRPGSSISIGRDRTIYVSIENRLLAVNHLGAVIWEIELSSPLVGEMITFLDGIICLITNKGILYYISHTGRILHNIDLQAAPTASPVLAPNNTIIISLQNERVVAVDAEGQIKWVFLCAGIPSQPGISREGIYIGTADPNDRIGTLVKIDLSNGTMKWNHIFDEGIIAPVISQDTVYSATKSGLIFGFTYDGDQIIQCEAGIQKNDTAGNLYLYNHGLVLFYKSGDLLFLSICCGVNKKHSFDSVINAMTVTADGLLIAAGVNWIIYAIKAPQYLKEIEIIWAQRGGNSKNQGYFNPEKYNYKPDLNNISFYYLKHRADSRNISELRKALTDISADIGHSSMKKRLSYLWFLEYIAGEFISRPLFGSSGAQNDFPEIRSKAVELLGIHGTIEHQLFLARLLLFEHDSTVQRSILQAIGKLRTNPEDRAVNAISILINKEYIDDALASAVIESMTNLGIYHGTLSKKGYSILLTLAHGPYRKSTRDKALNAMRKIIMHSGM